MIKVGKRLLSGVVSLALAFSMITTVPLDVSVKANVNLKGASSGIKEYDYGRVDSNGDTVWDVYEVSYANYIKNTSNNFANPDLSYSYTGSDNFNISTVSGNNISSDSYYTSDRDMCMKCTGSAGSVRLNSFTYSGSFVNELSIKLPDVIVFHQIVKKDASKAKDSNITTVNLIESTFSLTLTSLNKAFSSDWNSQGNCSFLDLKVPKGVTVLDTGAFQSNTKLKKVEFSNAIQSIGDSCFKGCNNLVSMDLANLLSSRVNTIPSSCFYQCSSLQNISIPTSILNIGDSAFYQCDSLDYIYLGDDVQRIGNNAFANCSHLRYVYITSNYQGNNWKTVVASNEVNKLVTTKVTSKPIVANDGTTSQIGSAVFRKQKINIFSKIDIDSSSVSVKRNGATIKCNSYLDRTYGYDTIAFTFDVVDKGFYTVSAKDILGNDIVSTFKYETDKNDTTAPAVAMEGIGSDEDSCYSDVKVTVTETGESDTFIGSVILNDKVLEVPQDSTKYTFNVSEEGEYTLEVKDLFGNSAIRKFSVDKTAPTISGVENNEVTKRDIVLKFSDNKNGVGIKSVTLNDVPQTDLTALKITASGLYTVVVTDKAGNSSVVNFKKDSIGPSINGVYNNRYYRKSIKLDCNSIAGIAKINVRFTSLDNAVKTYETKEGSTLVSSGRYDISLTDLAGTTLTYNFVIDKTAPKISGVANNGCYRSASRTINLVEANLDKATVNGSSFSGSTTVSNEGSYSVYARDKAGNVTKVKFKIDRTAPSVSGVKSNKTYKKSVKIKVSDRVSGVKTVKVNGKSISLKRVSKGYKISKKGSNTITVKDKAGNSRTIKFKIK